MSHATFFEDPTNRPASTQPPMRSGPDSQTPVATLTTSTTSGKSFLETFFSSFLHENNIKWMLLVGAAIVTVCSVKLVAQSWDSWHTSVKFLSLLSYVCVLFAFAQGSDRWLHLKATSATLRGLTLFLLPITFLSMGWLSDRNPISSFTWMFTVGVGGIAAAFVSDRILTRFLESRQWTLLIAFSTLSWMGAIPNAFASSSVLFGLVAWAVATVGIVKVNRHVFWLSEERKKPILFGFFPILLLGTQFLLLVAIKLEWHLFREWLGLALSLCAFPIAATSHTVIDVFRKRTGGLVSLWPAAISVPMFLSMALTIAGVLLSTNFFLPSSNSLKLLVPTSIIATFVFGWAAKDTRKPVFTWCMLLFMTTAYVFAPTWFADQARALASITAQGLQESKLPIAFYGLTCLPLLAVWNLVARRLKKREIVDRLSETRLWSTPLKLACDLGLVALFILSLTHIKAAFLIPLVYVAIFVVQAYLWNDRRYLIAALTSATVAVLVSVPFFNAIVGANLDIRGVGIALGVWCNVLLIAPTERWMARFAIPDSFTAFWPRNSHGESSAIGSVFGYVLTMLLSVASFFILAYEFQGVSSYVGLAVVGLTLLASLNITLLSRNYFAGLLHAALFLATAMLGVWNLPMRPAMQFEIIALISFAISVITFAATHQHKHGLLSRLMDGLPSVDSSHHREAFTLRRLDAILVPLRDLVAIYALVLSPLCILSFVLYPLVPFFLNLQDTVSPFGAVVASLWLLAYAVFARNPIAAVASLVFIPVALTSCLIRSHWSPIGIGESYLIVVWTLSVAVVQFALTRSDLLRLDAYRWNDRYGYSITTRATSTLLYLVPSLTFVVGPSIAFHLAGLLGTILAMVTIGARARGPLFTLGTAWSNVIALHGLMHWMNVYVTPFAEGLFYIPSTSYYFAPQVLFGVLGFNLAAIEWFKAGFHRESRIVWTLAISALAIRFLVASCVLGSGGSVWYWAGFLGLVVLAAAWTRSAVRENSTAYASLAVSAMITAFGYIQLSYFERVANGYFAIIWAILAITLHVASEGAASNRAASWKVFHFPCLASSLAIVLVQVGLGIGICLRPDAFAHAPIAALGLTGMAIYFGALACHKPSALNSWIALLVANVSLASFCRTFGFTDLQFYFVPLGLSVIGMTELMKSQLNMETRKALRLIGALLILVSPIFSMFAGSWWHYLTLLLLSVVVILMAIGMRVRVLMHTGNAFLVADLIAILVRSAMDHPGYLWIGGLSIGVAVISIAAVCEIYRERILSRIRVLSEELATWN